MSTGELLSFVVEASLGFLTFSATITLWNTAVAIWYFVSHLVSMINAALTTLFMFLANMSSDWFSQAWTGIVAFFTDLFTPSDDDDEESFNLFEYLWL